MKNIVLIGMPATGKSTVGVILAKRLGFDFLDTDIAISKQVGLPLPELLRQVGMERFIQIEGEVAAALTCTKTVIATGGSMVLSPNAMMRLKETGTIVWLDTPLASLLQRLPVCLADRGVVAPADMTATELYRQRLPFYQQYADLTISCDGDTEQVLAKLEAFFAAKCQAAFSSALL